MHYAAILTAALLVAAPALTTAHGYLSSPPPRGIQKVKYQIDDLASPNSRGLCRGEPVGHITHVVAGGMLTLGFNITAPHTGPCRVTLLDANLQNERPVAEKYDCAAPGRVAPWTITLPSNVTGHMVLRWYWEGRHISNPGEPYEQCIDLYFGGGRGGNVATFGAQAVSEPATLRSAALLPAEPDHQHIGHQHIDAVPTDVLNNMTPPNDAPSNDAPSTDATPADAA